MNALARTASTALPRATQRLAPQHQRRMRSTLVKDWLSDPSTYPIIIILSAAVGGCAGFMLYKFMYCPDVRVTKNAKGQMLRSWQ